MRVLVTGGAGFIGSHLVDCLIARGYDITVLDNFDTFYGPHVKWKNIRTHIGQERFRLIHEDIRNLQRLRQALQEGYDCIVHLAAKPGVRSSFLDPCE
jgi:UDP-glucuronate 4-epimerase